MFLSTAYRRPSDVRRTPGGLAIALSPNLRRDRVSFDGRLKDPLAFREAVSALHDVVVSDLRYVPADKSAYEAYQRQIIARESTLRAGVAAEKRAELHGESKDPLPEGLLDDFHQARGMYWSARQQYSNHLMRHDPQLWRRLVPCDPVITVAEDALLFECFSMDESSYGCLSVASDRFDDQRDVALGTTNVDYSWSLYDHFQKLRSYRSTRFNLDPSGFEVATSDSSQSIGGDQHREEKIDLPDSWLRGFMQLQSAMSMPMRRVRLGRSAIYNLLAFLTRHRAKRSPRAIRFELEPGREPNLVLEPWQRSIAGDGGVYEGRVAQSIRVWGRDRLHVLRRLLPLIDSVDVHLIDSGLPSFWVARMGGMQMVLGLSGWTTNDWSAGSALTQLMPPVHLHENELLQIASAFRSSPIMGLDQIAQAVPMSKPKIAVGLNTLAHLGQVIHDLPQQAYRWRQVMPEPVTQAQLGNDDPETAAARALMTQGHVEVDGDRTLDNGLRLITGAAQRRDLELLIDGDGRVLKAKCTCSHHFKNGLRKGPCRHLQALRNVATSSSATPDSLDHWYQQYWN
ncbi:hypothetical protein [Neorhodopirellula pilleata]|uniref:SWIM-type domain-containing protein n=1 Tax=Neorhodopirellula pilleata TaxID=2714738 RepID=A0A5C6A0V7_9BACT|nr:hypothetical protein [Neorhodopirellula pilleata]TWT92957.1 hypothetical protein Pla100_42730 [Neorhodopirellula pilleata]